MDRQPILLPPGSVTRIRALLNLEAHLGPDQLYDKALTASGRRKERPLKRFFKRMRASICKRTKIIIGLGETMTAATSGNVGFGKLSEASIGKQRSLQAKDTKLAVDDHEAGTSTSLDLKKGWHVRDRFDTVDDRFQRSQVNNANKTRFRMVS